MRRTATILLGIGLLVVAAAHAGLSHRGQGHRPATPARGLASRVQVHGHLRGLYPGVETRLPVQVHNGFGFAVRVRAIRVAVSDASSACTRANLRVGPYRGTLLVPSHRGRWTSLPLAMSADAPAPCQGARFPLRFTSTATR